MPDSPRPVTPDPLAAKLAEIKHHHRQHVSINYPAPGICVSRCSGHWPCDAYRAAAGADAVLELHSQTAYTAYIELHDYPLPSGYGDRAEAAERRLRRGWGNVRCPRCGLYGWTPGRPTGDPCDERIPAPVNDSAAVAAQRED